MRTANELMVLLRQANLDIVLDTWVSDVGKEPAKVDFWGEVGAKLSETQSMEDRGYTPWKP